MKNVLVLVSLLCLAAIGFQSCKQCSNPKDDAVSTADSTVSPEIRKMNEAIRKDSLNPNLYIRRAKIYENENDLKSAVTDVYIALLLDSLNPEFYEYGAELFIKNNDANRAIALLNEGIRTDSSHIPFYILNGKFAFLLKQYDVALSYLNRAIDRDPFAPGIYFYKGMVYLEKGDTTKALSAFQTCVEQDPKNADAFLQIGLLLQQKKDKMAKKYIDNAVKANPKAVDALYAKGFAEQDAKLYEQSIQTFRQIIEREYRNEEALYAIGYSYLMLDSFPQAYKHFDLATKIDQMYYEAYYKKGVCAEQLGNIEEAKTLYRQSLNLSPKYELAQKALKRLGEKIN